VLNGISLFSGYAGIDLALSEWVKPIIYCEIEKYAQAILLSRMDDESIPFAPIWNDVTTLDGTKFRGLVDVIYGGFPCQDISCAGLGKGLEGKRSGLFYEIIRICQEASPQFIFLENVPAIRTNGSVEVQEALASIGYDCRWGALSAAEIGANHKRDRWFCLATNASNSRHGVILQQKQELWCKEKTDTGRDGKAQSLADSFSVGTQIQANRGFSTIEMSRGPGKTGATSADWWSSEPDMGRVVDGCPNRSHRIKALGNGVVPLQVKTAFKILMGIQ